MGVVTYDPQVFSLIHMRGTEPLCGGNAMSQRSGDPNGVGGMVPCHHLLTYCAHEPPPTCVVGGTFLHS